MEKEEKNQSYTLDEEAVKVVSDTQASSKLKRLLRNKKIMGVAVYASLFIAASVALAGNNENAPSDNQVTELNGTYEGNRYVKFDDREDTKQELIKRGLTEEEAEERITLAEQKANKESGVLGADNEATRKLATTEADRIVKEREAEYDDNSIKFDDRDAAKQELIKRGLTEEEAEERLALAEKSTKQQESMNDGETTIYGEHGDNITDGSISPEEENKYDGSLYEESNYWILSDEKYVGFNTPKDTLTSVWFPTGEQTPYEKVGEAYVTYPIWANAQFDYEAVIRKVAYEQLANMGTDSNSQFNLPTIYGSADRAVFQKDPVSAKYYANFVGSKVEMPYLVENGKISRVEDMDVLSRLNVETLSFPLVRPDRNGQKQIIGFINGVDLVTNLTSQLKEEYDKNPRI